MTDNERKLNELRWMIENMRWLNPPLKADYLSNALNYFGNGYQVGLPLWWSDDTQVLCAGFDWIELMAMDRYRVQVNRMIEPGQRERVEWLPYSTPVMVFRKVQ